MDNPLCRINCPVCPCNSCTHNEKVEDCCIDVHRRDCLDTEPCPFYEADEKEPDHCHDSDSKN